MEVVIRKSRCKAADAFDYQKLCRPCPGLLDCTIEQNREELKFTYDVHDVKAWAELRREKKEFQMAVLLDVKNERETAEIYDFMLTPQNLYYDIHGRVHVMERDIYGVEECFQEAEFCKQYQALIGCTLSAKYKFTDYYNGGMDLLKEDRFLKKIAGTQNVQEVVAILREEYVSYKQMHQRRYTEVVKKRYFAQRRALVLIGIIAVAALALCGYLGAWERPYQQAVIAANEAYLQSDYETVVNAMATVEPIRMNLYQKYILAVSCVKCESFNAENQKNILNMISLNGDEKVMEYWIYINRLEMGKAADIALQLSSDQLLYYAYLKEKTMVENDSTLPGEEKAARLSELESKLEPLKDEYSSLTGE